MSLPTVSIAGLEVSRVIVGGNPLSGFSHQSPQRDQEMLHYFTTDCVKRTLADAERLGVNTHLSRADHHVMRYLMEYWDEGGKIQWIAQTCPEVGSAARGVSNGIDGNASAVYLHGGWMDFMLAQGKLDEVPDRIKQIHDAGLPAGAAGHVPEVFDWAEEHLDCDFYMCSYYNPSPRDRNAEQAQGIVENYDDADRAAMLERIRDLSKPVIHYKVMAAGRNDPADAMKVVAENLRENDVVCIGVFPKDNPDMLAEDIRLLNGFLGEVSR
jgi:hypothetical protein